MNLGRLFLVVVLALALSAPATAAISDEGQGGVYDSLSSLAKVVTDLG